MLFLHISVGDDADGPNGTLVEMLAALRTTAKTYPARPNCLSSRLHAGIGPHPPLEGLVYLVQGLEGGCRRLVSACPDCNLVFYP